MPNSITLAGSKLAPNMFGASSELASVIEFGFKLSVRLSLLYYNSSATAEMADRGVLRSEFFSTCIGFQLYI